MAEELIHPSTRERRRDPSRRDLSRRGRAAEVGTPVEAVAEVRRAVELALTDGGLRPKRGRILVALSGGPDSRVLLDALVSLATRQSLTVSVCVVDHGLRHGSEREAQAALEVARRLGVQGSVERVVLTDKSPRGARDARYRALARAAVACGAEAIALGHTASDQAETLLDHLLRGAGSRGLGAMAPRRGLGALPGAGVATEHLSLVRPLLFVSRAEVEAYVLGEGLAVVRDPTNEDLRFRRSRIRQRVMPLLRAERPDLDRAMARLCERLRLDADFLDAEAAGARRALTASRGATATQWLDLEGLSALHPALAARILREACEEVGVPGDRVPLDGLLRLCRGRQGTSQIDLPGGIVAERRYARLRIGPSQGLRGAAAAGEEAVGDATAEELHPEKVEIPVPRAGRYVLGRLTLRVPKAVLGAAGPGGLVFRRPRRGDRLNGKKLSDLLIDQKVARPDRPRLWALAEVSPSGRDTLRWVGLPADGAPLEWVERSAQAAPGALAWECPSSGVRPVPIMNPVARSRGKSGLPVR